MKPSTGDAASANGPVPLGLYLHIPFCRKRCKFCYFKVFTETRASDIEQYVAALSREIELVSQLPVMGDRAISIRLFRRRHTLVPQRAATADSGASTAG